ncbi:MAG: DUF1648 domain-containing protein [Ferruginibacter sp.]
MDLRPKIKNNLTKTDKLLEIIGKILLCLMWGITIYVFVNLPEIIPVHFNAAGNANRYGNKITLLILPVIATIIYAGITKLNNYPHLFNYMIKITEKNAAFQYTVATRMLRYVKLAVLIIFTLLILFTYLSVVKITKGIGIWFLPFTFGILFIPTLIMLIKSTGNKNQIK